MTMGIKRGPFAFSIVTSFPNLSVFAATGIPDVIEALPPESRLKQLYLEQNNLSGPIPTEIGLKITLGKLKFNNNRFTGRIPTELALLSNLHHLEMADNILSGPIPTELGRIPRLMAMHFLGKFVH